MCVTWSWIQGNTGKGLLPIPSKDFPAGGHKTYFVKRQKLTKGHQQGFRELSQNSVDLVLFDGEKHYLPKFDSEM